MKMIISELPHNLPSVLVYIIVSLVCIYQTSAQTVLIPDIAFKSYLIQQFDGNGDGEIDRFEAEQVQGTIDISQMGISDLTGLEAFVNIQILRANLNFISSINLSANQKLTAISVSHNILTSIDLRRNAALKAIYLSNNQLSSFDPSGNPNLEYLDLSRNQLDQISLERNTRLKRLDLYDNAINSIDLRNQPLLQSLNIFENELTVLNLEANPLLEELSVSGNPLKGFLDLGQNRVLSSIQVSRTRLERLNIANGNNHQMGSEHFEAINNDSLTCIQVDDVNYAENTFTAIDEQATFRLQCVDEINTGRNIYECVGLPTIARARLSSDELTSGNSRDFSEGSVILYQTSSSNFGKLLVTGFFGPDSKYLEFEWVTYSPDGVVLSTGILRTDSRTDLDQGTSSSSIVNSDFEWSNAILRPQGSAQFMVYDGLVYFNDNNFKAALLDHSPIIDLNGDGEIQNCEALSYDGMLNVSEKGISDLKGIESFTAVQGINAANNALRLVDLYDNVEVMFLDFRGNQIQQLNLNKNVKLTSLEVGNNQLTRLDVSKNYDLGALSCYGNELTDLYLKENSELTYLNAGDNAIELLDLRKNLKLRRLVVSDNRLTALDVTNNTQLVAIEAVDNEIDAIDLGNNPLLHTLTISDNKLKTLDLGINVNLRWLRAERNQLRSVLFGESGLLQLVEVGKNQLTFLKLLDFPLLIELSAANNQLEWVDIPASHELQQLNLSHNSLEGGLDLSNLPRLRILWLDHNLLSTLSISNGSNHLISNAYNINLIDNPNLNCVEVDDIAFANRMFTLRDAHTLYSEDCSGSRIGDEQIAEDGLFDEISVYPNPTADYFTVSAELQGVLVIYNSAGAKVKEVKLDGESLVNISEQNEGVYLLSILDQKRKQVYTSKLIKTHQ